MKTLKEWEEIYSVTWAEFWGVKVCQRQRVVDL